MPRSRSAKAARIAVLVASTLVWASAVAHAQNAQVTDDSVLNRVLQLPGLTDVLSRFDDLYNRDSIQSTMYVEGVPNDSAKTPMERKYYQVYVGESHTDHTVRWFTILVSKDLQTLKYYDVIEDRIRPAGYWRTQWPATRFLKGRHRLK